MVLENNEKLEVFDCLDQDLDSEEEQLRAMAIKTIDLRKRLATKNQDDDDDNFEDSEEDRTQARSSIVVSITNKNADKEKKKVKKDKKLKKKSKKEKKSKRSKSPSEGASESAVESKRLVVAKKIKYEDEVSNGRSYMTSHNFPLPLFWHGM